MKEYDSVTVLKDLADEVERIKKKYLVAKKRAHAFGYANTEAFHDGGMEACDTVLWTIEGWIYDLEEARKR